MTERQRRRYTKQARWSIDQTESKVFPYEVRLTVYEPGANDLLRVTTRVQAYELRSPVSRARIRAQLKRDAAAILQQELSFHRASAALSAQYMKRFRALLDPARKERWKQGDPPAQLRPELDLCRCSCHEEHGWIKHVIACCALCPYCGKRIVRDRYLEHVTHCNPRS